MMLNRRVALGALAICGLMLSATSKAQSYSGEATLATPVATPSETVIDGITWRCEDTKCVGRSLRAPKSSQTLECRKLALAVGQVTAFRSRGRRLSDDAIAECNGGAK